MASSTLIQHRGDGIVKANRCVCGRACVYHTCSGLSPGGTHAYSSSAQPESSSEVEFLWKSYISLVMVFSISRGMAVTTCSSQRHLQWTQMFLQDTGTKQKSVIKAYSGHRSFYRTQRQRAEVSDKIPKLTLSGHVFSSGRITVRNCYP